MNISDNVLKYHLRNAYFVAGTSCGGKTTMTRMLAEKYGLPLYIDGMDNHNEHKKIVSAESQPAMSKQFSNWTEYFNRPYKEYAQWLTDCLEEDLDMVLMDIISAYSGKRVIVNIHMPLKMVSRFTERERVVFLVAEPDMVVKDYFSRPDHKEILDCIMSLPNPDEAKKNCDMALRYAVGQFLQELYKTDWYYIVRDEDSSVENTMRLIEKHFGLA